MTKHIGSKSFTVEVTEPPHTVTITVIGEKEVTPDNDMVYSFAVDCPICDEDLSNYFIVVEDGAGQSSKKLPLTYDPDTGTYISEQIDLYDNTIGKRTFTARLVS